MGLFARAFGGPVQRLQVVPEPPFSFIEIRRQAGIPSRYQGKMLHGAICSVSVAAAQIYQMPLKII